ncbi:MAG: L,D-transpeptidase family protein [Woeseia sp.]
MRRNGAGFFPARAGARSFAALILIAAGLPLASHAQALSTAVPWSDARQLVLVITPEWNASTGTLRTFSRSEDGWESATTALPVVIGRAGAAWGGGLHPSQATGPRKQEGDGRSPAGVFTLGVAFGYANSADSRLPYAPMDANDYCIDVTGSPLYNQIVDAGDVGADAVAGSTEPMRRDLHLDGDQLYKLGFVIEHNPGNEAGLGSCIFAHLWKAADAATTGCTAMAEADMQKLLAWLIPDADPVFVLLPQQQYDRLQIAWNLPRFTGEPL